MLVSGCTIGGCGADKGVQQAGPKIAIVDMDRVVKNNPAYTEYKQLKDEYDNLESQYKAEQQSLNTKSQAQAMALKGLSADSALTDSLNTELQARVAAKEHELNAKLQEQRIALINKYRGVVNTNPTESDLRIVNLQLELRSRINMHYYTPEGKLKAEGERAAKEAELKKLLEARNPGVNGSGMTELERRVNEDLEPMIAEGKHELENYAASVSKELQARRDTEMQTRTGEIMKNHNLPDPIEWNTAWNEKLELKKAEVDAMHDAILEDIKTRVAILAKEKDIDLVVADYVGNVDTINLTDAVVESYSKQ